MRVPIPAVSLLGLVLAVACIGNLQAEELNLDFTLVNSTGYTIKEVYVAPTAVEEWGENIMGEELKDGERLKVTFHPKAAAAKWDIKIMWTNGEGVVWTGYKLTDISTITLKYDEKTKVTSATTE
jgi:hypothetical protein